LIRFDPLYGCPFLAFADRFAINPLLVSIAGDFERPLGAAVTVATVSFFVSGFMQVVYGLLSDRLGRVRVLRGALVGMGVANALAAAAPDLGALVLAKGLAAGFAAALLPTSLVYVGDTVTFTRRQQMIANMLAAGALGIAIANVAAGLLSRFATWRLVFLTLALAALVLCFLLRRVPESLPDGNGVRPLAQVRRVFADRWTAPLLLLALVEGSVMFGFLTFLAPALQFHGQSAAVAGLVVATYGASVFAGMQLVKALLRRDAVSPARLVAVGSGLLVVAYVTAAANQGPAGILAASILIGLAFAFVHSTLQTWGTELAPEARGTATALFVTAVFLGAAIAVTAVANLATEHRYGLLFVLAACMAALLGLVGAPARSLYGKAQRMGH
jgi:predicted MFS family arabinose efflux permease